MKSLSQITPAHTKSQKVSTAAAITTTLPPPAPSNPPASPGALLAFDGVDSWPPPQPPPPRTGGRTSYGAPTLVVACALRVHVVLTRVRVSYTTHEASSGADTEKLWQLVERA